MLQHGPGKLLQKKGIARRLGDNLLLHLVRHRGRLRRCLHHAQTLMGREMR